MGYYMRYIMADNRVINLATLVDALKALDSAYAFHPDQVPDMGDLFYSGQKIAQMEINHPGEEIFEDDIAEFGDMLGTADDPLAQIVLNTLKNANLLLAVEAFWAEGRAEDTLTHLDPLWDWLFANRHGILQADGEGFYDASGLIVERNFTL
jgi:hypothetical protein